MILKYDDHVAHKKVEKFLKSTKAVDFLGIHNDKLYFDRNKKLPRSYTR